jgi:glycosyltransferase 2 family protein
MAPLSVDEQAWKERTWNPVRFSVGLIVATACLFLVIRNVHLNSFSYALKTASPLWIALAISAFSIGYACRIERWRQMLKHENPALSWIQCAGPFFAGYAANNLLPLRAGDVLRSFAFSRTLGAPPGAVVATLLIERLLDMLVIVVLLGGALAAFGSSIPQVYSMGIVALTVGSSIAVLVLLAPRTLTVLALKACDVIRRVSPKLGGRVVSEIHAGATALENLTARRSVIRSLSLSIFIWVCEGCVFWFSALALPSLKVSIASWLALPAGTLATLLPSTPGFIGTFEYAVVLAMTTLGNTGSAAAAYAFLVHALLALPSVAIGGVYMLVHASRRQEAPAQI